MSAKICVVGNLTRDVTKRDANGVVLLTGSVAVRTFTRDEEGNYETDFYDFSTRYNVDYLSTALKKGMKVQVWGDPKQRTYKDKNGNDRFAVQINKAEVEILQRIENASTGSSDEDDELPL